MKRCKQLGSTLGSLLLLVMAACAGPVSESQNISTDEEPLSDEAPLHVGYPDPQTLPYEFKTDGLLPAKHSDLVAEQSSVKSQGRRGVCSIFSTAGLMEHMYIKAGMDPEEADFSEQYLQWSAKFELNTFPDSSGSNAYYNLQSISRFGIVKEADWPYEPNQWTSEEDEDCDKEVNDRMPTKCFTNGHPSDETKAADKFNLPRAQWVSTWGTGIKNEIAMNKRGVVVGLSFFYQAWNHGRSPLPTNADYKAAGYVLYPNEKDQEESRVDELRAGHSIYLVGWDDELEVTRLDEEGNPMTDAEGNELIEKGFFVFKNSWGTEGFGVDNPFGAGYGYISYRYVKEYASAYTTSVPNWTPPPVVEDKDVDTEGSTEPVVEDNN